ncbi:MAG: hypothetical protein KH365_02625 [Clostridiales bacterium]|nr:hypothetical protein [Clostridiales bacterium]
MKKRILSFALAAFMVVSVLSLLGIGSFAAESTGLKITVGNSYAQAGTTAYVDVFVSADSFAGNYNHLRSWQIRFTSSNPDVKISATQDKLYTSDGNYMSPNSNVSLTSAFISAGSGKNIGTNEQILAKGGMKIGSIAFEIPADATGKITIGVTDQYFDNNSGLPISTLQFEKVPGTSKNLFEEATWESGTITILDEEVGGVAPAKAGSGEDFTVGDGLRVGSMTKGQKMTGTFGTLTIPATVTSIAKPSLSSASADAVVLKNTNLDKTSCGAAVEITPKLYYYRLANGLDTTLANIEDYITNESTNEPTYINGLQASATAKVNGSAVTVLGYIAPNDLAFSDVTVEVEFVGVKTKSYTTTAVYTTLTGVATTSSVVNAATGEELIDGTYLTGLTVKGVPAGTYTLKVTLFATAQGTYGANEVVCSDVVTITNVTVA